MFKEIKEMPTKPGTQFIAIWEYEGDIWSETLMKVKNGVLD